MQLHGACGYIARCRILVLLQLMGWSFIQASSAIDDFSVWFFLVLLEFSSEASLGLSDVDLSTRAWYLVYDVRLFLDGERV